MAIRIGRMVGKNNEVIFLFEHGVSNWVPKPHGALACLQRRGVTTTKILTLQHAVYIVSAIALGRSGIGNRGFLVGNAVVQDELDNEDNPSCDGDYGLHHRLSPANKLGEKNHTLFVQRIHKKHYLCACQGHIRFA